MYIAGEYGGFLYLVNVDGGIYRYAPSADTFTYITSIGQRLLINQHVYVMVGSVIYYMTQTIDNSYVKYDLYSFNIANNKNTLLKTIEAGYSYSSSGLYSFYTLFEYNGTLFSIKYRADGATNGTPTALIGNASIGALLPTKSVVTEIAVYKGKIYAWGNNVGMLVYNGSSWASLPAKSASKASLSVFNNELHYLFILNSACAHYKYDGNSFTELTRITSSLNTGYGSEIVAAPLNNSLYIYINNNSSISPENTRGNHMYEYTLSYLQFDSYTVILQRGETGNGVYQTAFANLSEVVSGINRFISGFDDCFYFAVNGFENAPMYYGDGSKWIKFKN